MAEEKNIEELVSDLQDELSTLKRRFDIVQMVAGLGSWEWNIKENTLYWSDEIYRIFGLEPQEFKATYESFLGFVHPKDRDYVQESVQKALNKEVEYDIFHRVVLKNGTEKIVNEKAGITFSPDGEPLMMIGTVQDVTASKLKEQELSKLTAIIENSGNQIIVTDTQNIIEYVNSAFINQTGYSKEDVVGQTPRLFATDELSGQAQRELRRSLENGETWRGNFKNRDINGKHYWVHATISPVKDYKGKITHYISVQENITAKMLAEEQIEVLSSFDEVTGTFNRKKFLALFDNWINYGTSNKQSGTLLTMNIDDFKTINDTYGHMAGDNILRYVSDAIKKVLNSNDAKYSDIDSFESILSRFSADEFCVFLPKITEKESVILAENLKKAVESGGFGDLPMQFRVSIGLSFFPSHGINSGELLSKSNIACMKVKERGGNNVYVFNAKDKDYSKISNRVAWQDKIQKAIASKQFTPWFQPLRNLATGKIDHYESLVRLVDDNKVYTPGNFIDIAEQFGLIGDIDKMVISQAMDFMQSINNTSTDGMPIKVSMNISGKDISDSSFLGFIRDSIKGKNIEASNIIFEITETAAVSDLAVAKNFINELRAMGMSFALDDFGVGFTSFKYLQEMDIDYIKIDGSFIRSIEESKSDQIFVKAIVDVARALGVKTIAEYVETEEALNLIKSLNVDYAQGYYVGKPCPKEEFLPV